MCQILIQLIQSSKPDVTSWYSELWSYFISSEVSKTLFFWLIAVIILYVIKYLFSLFANQKESSSNEYINHSDELAKNLVTELTKPQNTCIMLKGKWGSGKTSFYKKQIEPNLDKAILLSCLSYNDVDSLKVDIINVAKPYLKFITPIKILYIIFGDKLLMPKNRIIVFDDFERTIQHHDFDIDRLINILILLKDEYSNSLLLLCNDDEVIDGRNIIKYREKLIGKIIRLPKLELSRFKEYVELVNKLNIQNDGKDKDVLEKLNQIYALESNIRLIIKLIQIINNMIKLDGDEVKFIIKLLQQTDLIFFIYAYSARGEKYQELLNKFDITTPINATLEYDIEEIKNNLESFDYEFNNNLKIDYLKLEFEELLMQSDANNFKEKAIAYLNKFITQITVPTKNQFNLDYVLYLLFIIWTAKFYKYDEVFEQILSSPDFMDQDTFKPVSDIVGSLNPIFHLYERERYYQIFAITSEISEDILIFEKEYCLFYRNKVIKKFIESTNKVLWNEVDLFADGWFIRCCNEEDKNVLFILGEDIYGVADLYVKSNKYLNLNIIRRWIDNKVEERILIKYYAKVLEEFDAETSKSDGKVKLLDWLLSEQIKSVPKVVEKFTIIREKLTTLNKIIKDYVSNDEDTNQQYLSLVQKHSGLMKSLIRDQKEQ